MASGVEARMPFLDHRIVELALRMPARGIEGGVGTSAIDKAVLRAIAARVLPGYSAPPKRGFTADSAPSTKQLRAMVARLARLKPMIVRRSVWRRSVRWKDPVRLNALWRLVVVETTAQVLIHARPSGR
jgi:asparagine synthetase B (glutamine-hydrolysing)